MDEKDQQINPNELADKYPVLWKIFTPKFKKGKMSPIQFGICLIFVICYLELNRTGVPVFQLSFVPFVQLAFALPQSVGWV